MDSVRLLLAAGAGAGSGLQPAKYLTFKKCTYKICVHWPFNSQRVHGTAACVKWSALKNKFTDLNNARLPLR